MTPMIRFGKTLDDSPIVFSDATLKSKHLLVSGKTGSGKSLLLASLIAQIALLPNKAIFIIDLSGDQFVFNYLRQACAQIGKVFRFLSLDERDASASFELFQTVATFGGNISRIVNFIVGALNLIYEDSYGGGFWSKVNFSVFAECVERVIRKGLVITVITLSRELALMAREPRRQREASEALFALVQLRHYPQLTSTWSEGIDLVRAVENSELNYLFLPTLRDPMTSRAVGGAAFRGVADVCVERTKYAADPRDVVLVVDECHQIFAGKNAEDNMTLVRKHGCQIILSHQTSSQLKLRHTDLRPVVKDNTSIRIHFTLPTEDDRQAVIDHSKTVTTLRKSTTAKGLGSSITMQEMEQPGFDANLCRDISGTFGHAVLIRELGDGHHEPIHMICEPPVSKEEYDKLARTPLPQRSHPLESANRTDARNLNISSEHVRVTRHAALMAIVEEKRRLRNEWRTQIPPRSNS